MKPVNRIFTRRPSLWQIAGMTHPSAKACLLLVYFAIACAVIDLLCSLVGVPAVML